MIFTRLTVLNVVLCLTIGCSAEESGDEKAKQDTHVFHGYKDTLDKANSVDQTLMQADRARREELQRQQN